MNFLNIFTALSVLIASYFANFDANSPQQETIKEAVFNFENSKTGALPENWEPALTGKGEMCEWKVVDDNGNKVVAQTSAINYGYRFNMLINKNLNFKDIEITLKFKGVKGGEDQGGGAVWRYIDENNYYVARANPLENNFRVYKVVKGNRIELASADRIDIKTNKWYTLKIIMKGNKIECFFNGKPELSVTDNTFTAPGKVGLWTKSDAQTYFDDIKVKGI